MALLAPGPPCKQGLAVVKGGCWVPSHPPRLHAPGIVAELHPSTRDPPYEQLLIRLGAGAGSMFHVEGRHHVSVMWHREGDWLVLT